MDNESECDWSPPIEIGVVESEIYEIPSGLPSLEDFIKTELEKEEVTKSDVVETEEALSETHRDDVLSTTEVPLEDGSIAGDHDGDEEAPAVTAEVRSEDEFEIPQIEIKKPKVKTKKQVVETFGMDTVKIDFESIKKTAKKQDEENRRVQLVDSTNNFIDKLIGDVVETCEYEDPDDILRARLDKNKVSKDLDDKMFQLDIEQKMRLFLNRKTVEYFRRKKATRPLMDDSPDNIINQLRKYREALMMVNRYKGLEESTTRLLTTKIDELREELRKLEKKSKKETNEFVDVVKKVFEAENSEKMEIVRLIESLTKKMQNMEQEISKVRFVLIQRQHAMAGLQERARKLEDLGNGLHMVDFEHLQTETQALGKKIEERNNELNRLHSRCNADIHTLAHIREKQHMMRNTISAQQEAFGELIEEKQSCREYLNGLKIERGSIRRELNKISFQNGLLDKPELLIDYDATEEKVKNLQAKITSVRAQQLIVDEKLKHMTKMVQH